MLLLPSEIAYISCCQRLSEAHASASSAQHSTVVTAQLSFSHAVPCRWWSRPKSQCISRGNRAGPDVCHGCVCLFICRAQLDEMRQLGKGGFGRVSLVRSRLDHRLLAIKQV
jgi:hypothetical protein